MGRYNFPQRKSLRLRDYDYSRAGAYFVTVCTQGRLCIFGHVENGAVNLNTVGKILADKCLEIPNHFSDVELDSLIVMPNHIHAIIVLPDRVHIPNRRVVRRGEVPSPDQGKDNSQRRGEVPSPVVDRNARHRKGAVLMPVTAHPDQHLSHIVAWYKYLSTKSVTDLNQGNLTRIWQRGYHDHIVRNEADLLRVREYIENNPLKWELDRYYK